MRHRNELPFGLGWILYRYYKLKKNKSQQKKVEINKKKKLQSRPFDYALQNKVNATLCKYYKLKKNKSQQIKLRYKKLIVEGL